MQRNGRVEYEAVLKSTSYLMYLVDMVRKPRRTCSYEYKVGQIPKSSNAASGVDCRFWHYKYLHLPVWCGEDRTA